MFRQFFEKEIQIMRIPIKAKILATFLLLTCMALIVSSGLYYYLLIKDIRHFSHNQIQIAFDMLFDEINAKVKLFIERIDAFNENSLSVELYTINVTQPQLEAMTDKEDWMYWRNIQEHISRVVRLPDSLSKFAPLIEATQIVVYNKDRKALAVYQAQQDEPAAGIYLDQAPGGTFLTLRVIDAFSARWQGLQDIPKTPLPEGIAAIYQGDIPTATTATFSRLGKATTIKLIAPIFRKGNLQGINVVHIALRQNDIDRYARFSQTHINIFAGNAFSVGTLPDYQTFALLAAAPIHRLSWPKFTAIPPIAFSGLTIGKESYYQGQLVFGDDSGASGAITSNFPRQLEWEKAKELLTLITVVTVVVGGVAMLVSTVLSAKLVRPIQELESAVIRFSQQDFSVKVAIRADDEIGTLASAFNAMTGQLEQSFETIQQEAATRKRAEDALRQLNEELEQRVIERTAEVVRQKYILDTFLENIPDSIYFKDRASRFIRGNSAIAALFGAKNQTELIGKSDFDFFMEAEARLKYEQEQQIIATGQPMLNIEEPDFGGRWALTTKMPLRDEHGEIIGTFGISRDITELKRAQDALQQAYADISVLNEKLKEENLRMSAELEVARRLQQMILPTPEELNALQDLDIVGYMHPADEVGGDYYDILKEKGLLHIGIGDVTGHGLESGVLMLMTQTAIRTLIEHGETDPIKFVATLNRTIYKNAQRMKADKTLTFALIEYQNKQIKIVGQHEDVLVVRKDGQIEQMDTFALGFPIGLEKEIEQWVASATVMLQPGDGIVLYTDGVTEAANIRNELYGVERLCQTLKQHWHRSANEIKQAVVDDVLRHIGEQKLFDDVTLVVLKEKGSRPK